MVNISIYVAGNVARQASQSATVCDGIHGSTVYVSTCVCACVQVAANCDNGLTYAVSCVCDIAYWLNTKMD